MHVVAPRLYHSIARHDDAMMEFDKALAIKSAAHIYLNRLNSRPKSNRISRMADLGGVEPQAQITLFSDAEIRDAFRSSSTSCAGPRQ